MGADYPERERRAPAAGPARDPAADPYAFFAARAQAPHPFQAEVWSRQAAGESGMLSVPTGAGKTYAATLGALCRRQRILYLSPLRAMTRDLQKALLLPVQSLGLGLKVETRTSDTSSAIRQRQRDRLPDALITTPESLCLLLTQPHARSLFSGLGLVVVDEWHELIDNKRGSQVELALARLRGFAPRLQTWGLSATLANAELAAQALVGTGAPFSLVRANIARPIRIETLLPSADDPLPYSGHFGTRMAAALVDRLDLARPTLVFCNTRAQAELWYQSIVQLKPEWFEFMGLHHGSIDSEERVRVEDGLKSGELRLVVCTSSLDLGVDLAPVDRVVQVGSPKGIAKLVQRAGRAAHRPGATAEVLCVPTHALQLVEISAVRDAVSRGEVEPRVPLSRPVDVLAQHLVSCALGGGFRPDELYAEVTRAWSYRDLSRAEFDRALALVRDGGATLAAYPEFRKVVADDAGVHGVPDLRIAALHRGAVGTIVSESTLTVQMAGKGKLGTIDEGFVAQLAPGQTFVFAGQTLELVAVRDLTVLVRPAKKRSRFTPHWPGMKLPITGSLGAAIRRTLHDAEDGLSSPELAASADLLEAQRRLSRVPRMDELLVELTETEEGHHLFLFPFEGRRIHEGLGALIALRAGRQHPATFTIATDDHGLELLHPDPLPWPDLLGLPLFSEVDLVDDILASVQISELMRRRFREVARVAGFVNPGTPWERKSSRQVQASASLLFDVFTRYDPENQLLQQARREVIEQHFEHERLASVLGRLAAARIVLTHTPGPSPFAMPILESRLSKNVATTESVADRLRRVLAPAPPTRKALRPRPLRRR
jgi:ATP-dependent Lhr-like helicase